MTKDPTLPRGALPLDAQRWLIDASQVGRPGSIHRRAAIQRAERRIEEEYPQYLRKEEDHGQS